MWYNNLYETLSILCFQSVFWNVPIHSTNPKESGPVYRLLFGYDMSGSDASEKAVQGFIEDWHAVTRLYELVTEFSDIYIGK